MIERVLGTWYLRLYESRYVDGQVRQPMGDNPHGVLTYTVDGRVSIHMTRHDREQFTSDDWMHGTDDEVRDAYETYIGYFGRFTLDADAGTVTHHIEGCSFQNWTGKDLTRYFSLTDNRLILTTDLVLMGGGMRRGYLIWERGNNVL